MIDCIPPEEGGLSGLGQLDCASSFGELKMKKLTGRVLEDT